MKKSNKGFTLVELLAAIVIMGILILFAAPAIVNMVSNNRDKMYIVDAEKLVALAENRINSSSSTIEKPNTNEVIIISMNYISNEEFETAPNRGEYVPTASYVVVKNNGNNKFDYSVAIVENLTPNKKNGEATYRGVQLVTSSKLQERNASSKLVKNISYEELKRIDSNNPVDRQYIQKQTTWNTPISKIYNVKETPEDVIDFGSNSPEIVKVVMASTSGKKYNSLDATLSLIAKDKDNKTSELSVYTSTVSYQDANTSKNKANYGNGEVHTKEFDFSKDNYSYNTGDKVNIYIIVKDPAGNEARSTYTYDIHQNEPPFIDLNDSGINKLIESKVNTPTALLRLSVDDDIEATKDLNVCITTDINAKTCANYKKYSEEFPNGEKVYNFSNNNCALNGQAFSLKVFVKDKFGLETSQVLGPYQIYKNQAPTINSVSINSVNEVFTDTGSLNTRITIDASDDITNKEDLNMVITSGSKKYTGKYDPENPVEFTLDGEYDGNTRVVTITVTDECGLSVTTTRTTYNVYKNQPPKIENLKIESQEDVCNNPELCPPEDGGSVKTIISLNVKDDIDIEDSEENIRVCLTENINDCQNDNNFKPYSLYAEGYEYEFDKNKSKPYTKENSIKTIYAVAKDSKKESSNVVSATYKLYVNKAPKVIDKINVSGETAEEFSETLPRITPMSEEGINTSLAKFELKAEDDLDENLLVNICYKLEGSSTEKCLGNQNYANSYTVDFKETNYNGQKYKIYAWVEDSYGLKNKTNEVTYELYKDVAPEIESVVARIDGGTSRSEITDSATDIEKRECSIDVEDGVLKYYGQEGNETTEENYKKQCLSCTKGTDEDEDGQEITVFYNKNGDEVTEAVQKEECDSYVTNSLPTTTEDKLRVSFIVKDLHDTYSVCISKDPNTCTNYVSQSDGKGFDGSSNKSNMVYFVDKAGIKYYKKSLTSVDDYYLFVKDSHGKLAVVKTTDGNNQEITSNSYLFTATKEDTMCKDVENVAFETEYKLTSAKPITAVDCKGQCYYATEEDQKEQAKQAKAEGKTLDPSEILQITSGTTANYKKRLYYKDRFNNDSRCVGKDEEGNEIVESIAANCSFKDCFFDSNKKVYNDKSIGMTRREAPNTTNYTSQDGEGPVINYDDYYIIYFTSYNDITGEIRHNPTNDTVSIKEYNAQNSKYKYNSSQTDYYLRIRD